MLNFYFHSGDGRVTEHPFLTVMHTIWVREHNRIANILYNSNPVLSDETIFQQARKIVIAELQHIIYSEYLPTIIGIISFFVIFRLIEIARYNCACEHNRFLASICSLQWNIWAHLQCITQSGNFHWIFHCCFTNGPFSSQELHEVDLILSTK